MPKLSHEALVQLIRNAPDLIPTLLRARCPELPVRPVHVTAAEFADLNFAEHRADAVLAVGGTASRPEQAFVVEVQLDIDPRKHLSWPLYVAGPRSRLGCPVTLVVIALDPAVARWCARPIDLGNGRCVLHPWVLGPADIPVITDLETARANPELAVLSVAAHANEPGAEHIALAALAAAETLDGDRAIVYPDFVATLLGAAARITLEQLMTTAFEEYRGSFARLLSRVAERHYETATRAEVLLKLLKHRGYTVPEARRQQILACRDVAQLDRWLERVLDAHDLDEIFA
jgi:hypothetical protein